MSLPGFAARALHTHSECTDLLFVGVALSYGRSENAVALRHAQGLTDLLQPVPVLVPKDDSIVLERPLVHLRIA